MMQKKRLLLLGGGHCHALLLKMWAMHPRQDVDCILISDVSHAPYSGMLPGLIAGYYDFDQAHIDLRRLAKAAGVGFILDSVRRIGAQHLEFDQRPPVYFDVLSINVGSVPRGHGLGGADPAICPVKPVGPFLRHWGEVCRRVADSPAESQLKIVLVGGGAGGVELAMAMDRFLGRKIAISLVHGGAELLAQQPPAMRRRMLVQLQQRGIRVYLGQKAMGVTDRRLELEGGDNVAFDALYWVTDAVAPEFLRTSGLSCDAKGALRVDSQLRVLGRDPIFAAGDCASIEGQERPKSGVFAVRSAGHLWSNVCRALEGRPLKTISLQKKALALLGTADGRAIAARGSWWSQGAWVWSWKQRVDQKFMRQFSALQVSPSTMQRGRTATAEETMMRCLGCGAKVGAGILRGVLQQISREYPDVLQADGLTWGLEARDDVAVWRAAEGQAIVQSIDYFPSLVDDPYLAGRLATIHAFSDILVKGAKPHSALLLAVLPNSAAALMSDRLSHMLSGVAEELRAMGAGLIGGHSAEGENMAVGLSVNGTASGRLLAKHTAQPGDRLILTKALGSGVLFAGAAAGRSRGRWIDACLRSMLTRHQLLSSILRQNSVHAATDVTGFGLLGHLLEMLPVERGLLACLDRASIPWLEGALALAGDGVESSLLAANSEALAELSVIGQPPMRGYLELLCDPQTAGPWLLSVDAEASPRLVAEMQALGFEEAAVIGEVRTAREGESRLQLF